MGAKTKPLELEASGRTIAISSPDKLYFPAAGITKGDLARYYLAVGEAAVRGIAGRPIVLKRYVDGIEGEAFYQKRAPSNKPDWLRTVTLSFPSGRTAEELVIDDVAGLLWIANLGSIDLHPHAVRADDLEHPDELRVDLDPGPGVPWADVQRTALLVREVLTDAGMVGYPKTSGSRGIHINVRIAPRHGFDDVRRAALALAREIERRAPALVTSKWWKEERHGVFIDYNQNAKDKTTSAAYSVRPVPEARVSAPLTWEDVPACELGDFTLRTMPGRLSEVGDLYAGIDQTSFDLEPLLEWSRRDERGGLGDAPWPPHYAKREGEGARVAPSRARPARPRKVPPSRRSLPIDAVDDGRYRSLDRLQLHEIVRKFGPTRSRAEFVGDLGDWLVEKRSPLLADPLESGLGSPKNGLELVRSGDLELCVGAIGRGLIGAESL